MPGRVFKTYNLILAEDRLSSQYAQSASTARRVQNLIPSRAGDLKRKAYSPPFVADAPLIGGQPAWYSIAGDYLLRSAGVQQRQFILGVTNNLATFLYKYSAGARLALPSGALDPPHNSGSGWIGDPVLVYSDGLLLISDGSDHPIASWTVYDGVGTWKGGFDIPNTPTLITPSTPGSIEIELFAEYAITEYDDGETVSALNAGGAASGRIHESPPSARLRFIAVTPATYDLTVTLPAAKNGKPGTGSDWTTGYPTHWRIYRSHVDGSTRLFRIAEILISETSFIDTVPMWGESLATAMTPLDPPYRNHKPPTSLVAAKMSNRIAMRDETRRARIWITGYAEVREQDPKSSHAIETVPGARNESITDLENLSDLETFIELPDSSSEARALLWWEEGLVVGSERSIIYVWGSKPEDFRPANTATYNFGIFNKNGFLLTSHGLVIFTHDRKIALDPISGMAPGDRTASVIDLGWQIQNELDKVDIRFSNRFQMVQWKQGKERDWLVLAVTDQVSLGSNPHLFVYDFFIPGWISFTDVAPTSVGIIQEAEGFQFLVGGNSGADRNLKVLTDFDSDANSPYQAAAARISLPAPGTVTFPAGLWRTALLDVGAPEYEKVWRFLSFFKRGAFPVNVTAYFDPADIDNLTGGLVLSFDQLKSNEFRETLARYGKRAVFEFAIPADGNGGSLEGVEINVSDRGNVGL